MDDAAARAGFPPAAAGARPGGLRQGPARAGRPWPSRTPPSATPTSPCWPPACAPGTSWPPDRPCPRCSRSCCPSRPGAGPPTTSPCASWARTPGTGWPRCARPCRTSACRCCSAAATPSATRRTRKRSRRRSSTRPPPPASTSSASSTPSTTSTRWRRPSAPSGTPAPPSPRSPCATPATCWTRTRTLYTLDYYLELAQKIVDAGAHILAIKDMAGLLRPAAAAKLVAALRERFDLPVHLHTHDTAGGQLATLLAAVDAGVDAVDVASASLAGTTSQPSASALVAALAHTPRDTGLEPGRTSAALEPYWEAVRRVYAPFESGLPGPHRPGLPARDPGRAALQPAPAGHGAGPGRALRGDRGHVHRGGPDPRPPGQGDPVVQGGGRPRPAPGGPQRRSRRTSTRTRRSTTSRIP